MSPAFFNGALQDAYRFTINYVYQVVEKILSVYITESYPQCIAS